MANTYKNIVISPSINSSTENPKIVFSGANTTTNTDITLRMYPTSSGTLSFEGSAGQLLSITNDLTGIIYSVNDVSGIPSISVYANGQIEMARYSGNTFIGSGNTSVVSLNGTANVFFGARTGNLNVGVGTYFNTITPIGDTNMNLSTPSGAVYFDTSIRGPIFYDYNNTSYYVDPASTSVVSDFRLASGNIQTVVGNVGRNLKVRALEGSSDIGVTFYDANDNWRMQLYASSGSYGFLDGNWASWDLKKVPDGVLYMNGNDSYYLRTDSDSYMYRVYGAADIRSPIFYDNNDTGYYVNPNSDSYLSAVYVNNWFRPQGDTGVYFQSYARGLYAADSGSNSYGNVTTYGSGRNGWQGWGIGSRHCFMSTGGDNVGVHDNSRGWIWYWNGSYTELAYGYSVFGGSARSPIFYDSNDTAYYADPSSTSILNYTYGIDSTFTAPGSAGTYVWVRAQMGGFNAGGDIVRFSISRSINDNGNSPYGGPSADFTVFSREWHGGQDFCTVVYGEHGSGSGTGGSYIANAGPKDQAGSGYWFYMKLEGGITYKIRRMASSGYIGNFSSTSDPGGIPAIQTHGLNILTTAGTTAGVYSQGNISSGGSVTASSDEKLKTNIRTIQDGLNIVKNLRGVTFNRLDLDDKQRQHIGVIAQEIEKYIPQVVEDMGSHKTVAYGNIVAVLIEAIKQLNEELINIKTKVDKIYNSY